MTFTVNEVYNGLGSFLLSLLPNEDWSKAELHLKIQPNVIGMSGKCFTTVGELSLRTNSMTLLSKR